MKNILERINRLGSMHLQLLESVFLLFCFFFKCRTESCIGCVNFSSSFHGHDDWQNSQHYTAHTTFSTIDERPPANAVYKLHTLNRKSFATSSGSV